MNNFTYYFIPNMIGIIFCIIFLYYFCKKYKNATYKEKTKPIKYLAIILIVLEVIKIFWRISVNKTFQPGTYPLIFCSFVMYFYPIICMSEENSIPSRVCKAVSIVPCFIMGILYVFINPYMEHITTTSFINNLHSRFYHFAMFAGSAYMLITKMYDFRFSDYYPVATTVSMYLVFSCIISIFLRTDISLFTINSKYFGFLYDLFGYCVGNLLLIIFLYFIVFLFYYVTNKILEKKKTEA
ncbi:MAG: hypothetical protein IKJ30_04075 [Bacilli bacterium]|nr:hypothetical protein [Bacilli bacterium]